MENKIYVQYLGSDGERNGEYQHLIAQHFKEFGILSIGKFRINHESVKDEKVAEELKRVYGDLTLEGIRGCYKDQEGMLYYNDRANSYEWINYSIIKDVKYQKSFYLKDKHDPIDLEKAISLVEKEKNTNGTVNEYFISYKLTSGVDMYTRGVKVTLDNGLDGYLCSSHDAPYHKRQNILIPQDYAVNVRLKQSDIPTITLNEYKEHLIQEQPLNKFMKRNKENLDFLSSRQIYVDTTHIDEDFLKKGFNSSIFSSNIQNTVTYINKIEEMMGSPIINTTNFNLQSDKELCKNYKDMYYSVLENYLALEFYGKHKFSFTSHYDDKENIFEIKVLDGSGKQISKLKLENAADTIKLFQEKDQDWHEEIYTSVIHIPLEKEDFREDLVLTIFEGNKKLSDISESKFKNLYNCFADCGFIVDDLDESVLRNTDYKSHSVFENDYSVIDFNSQISVIQMVNSMVNYHKLDLTPINPENKKTKSIKPN